MSPIDLGSELAEAEVTLVSRLAGREEFPPGIMPALSRLGKCEE